MPLVPLQPLRVPRRAAAARVAQPFLIPAPVGGLNYRDPISAMDPRDALVLTNFIPKQQGVELRRGYQEHASFAATPGVYEESSASTAGSGPSLLLDFVTLSPSTVSMDSVFGYVAPDSAENKVFAAADGKIYDVTGGGVPSVIVATTGSAANEWWTTQFSTPGDTFLLAVSPGAGYWTYSTSTGWVDRTASTTGLPGTVRTVAVWKQRVWFTVDESPDVYYLDTVNAVTGSCSSFPMGSILRNGGYVSALVNWTVDAGISIDDYLVVIGTQGDIGVWEGTDPTSASTFNLRGAWYVGPVPLHGSYFTQFGGDVMIVSELGLVPMSRLINGQWSVDNQNTGPAAKIQTVFAPLVQRLRLNKFFNVFTVPGSEVLVISMPVDNGVYRQFCMNVTTGAWGQFEGMPIRSAAVVAGQLYFGTTEGSVCLGLVGSLDGVDQSGQGGSYIVGEMQCAFNAFGTPAALKKFGMVRPIFYGVSAPAVKVSINTQYSFLQIDGAPAFDSGSSSLWDVGSWGVATWAAPFSFEGWFGTAGLGYYGSLRIKMRALPGTQFLSANVMTELGGVM